MTLAQFLRYLYNASFQATGEKGAQERVDVLRNIVDEMRDAADQHHDNEVSTLCDDMMYMICESFDGVRGKGNYVLPDIEALLSKIEQRC